MKLFHICYFLFFAINCSSQSDCERFKIGKYKLADATIKHNSVVERTDTLQIEIDISTGEKSVFKINWVDDCEYILRVINAPKAISDFFDGHVFKVVITDTSDIGYTFNGYLDEQLISSNKMVVVQK